MTTAMADRRRTVVVSGVPTGVLELGRMVDKLTIHFQSRRRSDGGDVEAVRYPTNMDGVAFVTFDRAEDAERVLRKDRHTMMDEEFTQDYTLTVFPFSKDVFLYVSRATVDLSVFGSDQASLIKSLQSAHRSIRFQALPQQPKASIEGPFSAVRALREDLVRRASRLKHSSQTAVVKPRESSPNPRVSSESSPPSCRDAKAKQEAANSSGLSKSQQSTGKARESQSLSLKERTPKASSRQEAFNESLAGGSFRRAAGEEIRTGIVSSSRLTRLPAEETVTKRHGDYGSSQQPSRSNKIPALQSPTRNSNVPQNEPRKGSTLSASNAEASEDIWVDLYTFRYIEEFQKKELIRCLKGVNMTTQSVEAIDLMLVSLTEEQPSGAASRTIRDALEDLETLIAFWQSNLRVHNIYYGKSKLQDKQKLIQICKRAASVYGDVLHVFEDSCVKVVGPSVTSHLFCKMVEDSIEGSYPVNPIIGRSRR